MKNPINAKTAAATANNKKLIDYKNSLGSLYHHTLTSTPTWKKTLELLKPVEFMKIGL